MASPPALPLAATRSTSRSTPDGRRLGMKTRLWIAIAAVSIAVGPARGSGIPDHLKCFNVAGVGICLRLRRRERPDPEVQLPLAGSGAARQALHPLLDAAS